ncbi:hypothetical protein PG1770B_1638 [Bifidobacterium pseudolongum subsp. globosum]|nr:hypothetical protein PG1770B_1638 [Bifidobacterium pseudolongum subsp. globosum]
MNGGRRFHLPAAWASTQRLFQPVDGDVQQCAHAILHLLVDLIVFVSRESEARADELPACLFCEDWLYIL